VTSSTGPLRVAIVEDDTRSREGLALLIGGTPGYRCVGSFGSVEEALSATIAPPPDVLLLDIELPGMSGSEGVRVLQERWISTQILMLTVFAERARVFESICNGACGYMLKQTPPVRLLEAIREAHEGGAPMSPEIARQVVTLFRRTVPPASGEPLTPQEVRLLGLLAEGYSYLNAAGQLNISVNTVRNYIRTIYDKLHVHSKSEAVSKAIRKGIIT
jgi:DNA-binding NarL/FixJ family response regulator